MSTSSRWRSSRCISHTVTGRIAIEKNDGTRLVTRGRIAIEKNDGTRLVTRGRIAIEKNDGTRLHTGRIAIEKNGGTRLQIPEIQPDPCRVARIVTREGGCPFGGAYA